MGGSDPEEKKKHLIELVNNFGTVKVTGSDEDCGVSSGDESSELAELLSSGTNRNLNSELERVSGTKEEVLGGESMAWFFVSAASSDGSFSPPNLVGYASTALLGQERLEPNIFQKKVDTVAEGEEVSSRTLGRSRVELFELLAAGVEFGESWVVMVRLGDGRFSR